MNNLPLNEQFRVATLMGEHEMKRLPDMFLINARVAQDLLPGHGVYLDPCTGLWSYRGIPIYINHQPYRLKVRKTNLQVIALYMPLDN